MPKFSMDCIAWVVAAKNEVVRVCMVGGDVYAVTGLPLVASPCPLLGALRPIPLGVGVFLEWACFCTGTPLRLSVSL